MQLKGFMRQAGLAAALGVLPVAVAQAVQVDLLVVYDDHSNSYFNGQVKTAMENWVAQTNTIYQNSQIDVQLRLVGVMQRNVAGTNMSQVLGNLRVDGAVLQKRNEVGADYVTQLHRTGSCGVGYVAVHKDWAFNVVGPGCGAQVLAHELGHNMGLSHSRRQGDTSGSNYRYGLGHGVDSLFATTMAYPSSFNTSWVPRFSNPRIDCRGLPCGVPIGRSDEADAATAVNNVKNVMAGFMPTRVGGGGGGGGDGGGGGGTTTGVSVYQHYNYGGYGVTLPAGQYRLADLQARGVRNDDLSSVRVPAGWQVDLYQHDNFGGTRTTFTSNNAGFPRGLNDTTSSIVVSQASTALTNGVYSIKPKHSGRCMDISNAATTDGAALVQWDCHLANNQRWILTDVGGGFFEVKSKLSGKCMDVYGGSASNDARLIQWSCHRGNNQQWKLERTSDGFYRLIARHSGKVADLAGAYQHNGAYMRQWDWVNAENQKFVLTRLE